MEQIIRDNFYELGPFFSLKKKLDNCVVDQTYLIVLPIETWDYLKII